MEIPENILELKLSTTSYDLLLHHINDTNWDYNSYQYITKISSWLDVVSIFNTLNRKDYNNSHNDFDIFIMRDNISPLWEDEQNRYGSFCSIKIDDLEEAYNIFRLIFIYVANNMLLKSSNDVINGMSYSPKKTSLCVIIKIWYKTTFIMNGGTERHFTQEILKELKKYSIKTRAIKPEY
jgi:hypothetical protein